MSETIIVINGESYPCYTTAGAMLRFKKLTGREVVDMHEDFEDNLTYLYCCVASASKREGRPFTYTLDDFADNIDVSDFTAWAKSLAENAAPASDIDGEKKSQ